MSSIQAESVIKSIIREIGTECSSRGVEVSETLIAFTVKAAVLDPDNAFNVDRALTKADVQQLIQVITYSPYIGIFVWGRENYIFPPPHKGKIVV